MNPIDDKTRATAMLVSNILFRTCVLGFVLLGLSSILTLSLAEQMYAVHSSMIEIPQPAYNALLFEWLGDMKILLLVFFLLPAIAIRWALKNVVTAVET